jgi:hypothetical protein
MSILGRRCLLHGCLHCVVGLNNDFQSCCYLLSRSILRKCCQGFLRCLRCCCGLTKRSGVVAQGAPVDPLQVVNMGSELLFEGGPPSYQVVIGQGRRVDFSLRPLQKDLKQVRVPAEI